MFLFPKKKEHIKLLPSLTSFDRCVGGGCFCENQKEKINYLYRCGIEEGSILTLALVCSVPSVTSRSFSAVVCSQCVSHIDCA